MGAFNPGKNEDIVTQKGSAQIGGAVASVSNITDASATVYANDNDEGIYTDYFTNHRYEYDRHIYNSALTSPNGYNGSKTATFRLGTETLLLIVDWSIERRADAGDYPIWPQSDPQNDNIILVDKHIECKHLDAMSDGKTVVYRISGTYVYCFKNPALVNMVHGRPVWMSKFVANEVYMTKQKPGIITSQ